MRLFKIAALIAVLALPVVAQAQQRPMPMPPQQQAPADMRALGSGLQALESQVQTVFAAAQMMNDRYAAEMRQRDAEAAKLADWWKAYVAGADRVPVGK